MCGETASVESHSGLSGMPAFRQTRSRLKVTHVRTSRHEATHSNSVLWHDIGYWRQHFFVLDVATLRRK